MNITPIIYDEIEVRHKGDKLIFIDSAKDEIHTFNVDEKALDLIKLIDGKKIMFIFLRNFLMYTMI